jgi:predicted DNA-binding WGR domain protein
MMEYFEYQEENVSCFFEITLAHKVVRTRHGRKGSTGVTTEKVFGDVNMAEKEYERIIKEKKEDNSFYFRLGDTYRL